MIRGWRYVGRLRSTIFLGTNVLALRDEGEPLVVDVGDVVGVAWNPSGPMRRGSVQVKHVNQERHELVADVAQGAAIPAICGGDYVFVATALGEHAFKRPS